MNSLQFSSGDVLADRRADYAEMLFAAGDIFAAADLLRDALALAPRWTAGWFRLGEMRETAGDAAAAAEAWREALRLDPADRLGATLRLSLVQPADAIVAPPALFVETLFDQYAEKFDASLVGKLGYRVPQLLMQAISEAVIGLSPSPASADAEPPSPRRGEEESGDVSDLLSPSGEVGRAKRRPGEGVHFAHAVDLGCGTGLMGERLRASASFLEGFDLSSAMLRKADAKRVYDRLAKADLNSLNLDDRRPDLVTAADVFIYLGELDDIVARISAMLSPDGLFAFSVERHDGPEAMMLRATRRFAHSEIYLRDLLARNGFSVLSLSSAVIRTDAGGPVTGLLVVAQRHACMELGGSPVPRQSAVLAAVTSEPEASGAY